MTTLIDATQRPDPIAKIIKACKTQREVVDAMNELQEESMEGLVKSETPPGLLVDNALDDEGLLATTILLAMRSHRGIQTMFLIGADVQLSSKPTNLLNQGRDMNGAKLSQAIAEKVVRDEKTIGFTLEVDPSGTYKLALLHSADPKMTRAKLQAKGSRELKAAIADYEKSLEREENGYLKDVTMKEYQGTLRRIQEENVNWKPTFILQTT